MPTSSPPPDGLFGLTPNYVAWTLPAPAQRPLTLDMIVDAHRAPGLAGLTAREALERLEAPARKPLRARLWTRLRQAWCDHSAATAHRIPGFGPDPVFERRCGRCKATWTELG